MRLIYQFVDSLELEANKSIANWKNQMMDMKQMERAFFKQNAMLGIDSTAHYQILFSNHKEWSSMGGSHMNGMGFSWCTDSVVTQETGKIYEGIEFVQRLFIDAAPKDSTLNWFPSVFERSDPMNCKWFAFSNEQFMILRYVHSYPYGNQTSFYSETVFWFKKTEN